MWQQYFVRIPSLFPNAPILCLSPIAAENLISGPLRILVLYFTLLVAVTHAMCNFVYSFQCFSLDQSILLVSNVADILPHSFQYLSFLSFLLGVDFVWQLMLNSTFSDWNSMKLLFSFGKHYLQIWLSSCFYYPERVVYGCWL